MEEQGAKSQVSQGWHHTQYMQLSAWELHILGGTFLRRLKFFCAWRFFCRQTSDLCLLPQERASEGLPAAAVAVLSSASSDADEER